MKAAVIEARDGATALLIREIPDPVPGDMDLLVRVRASALNQADLRRAGSHFAGSDARSGPAVAGLEMAGEVIGLGDRVQGFRFGDRVMAMTGASWAEQVAVDHRLAVHVPATFSWLQAAGTPISFLTAHDALVTAAGLQSGESVLVQGASSAVGLACVQVARALGASAIISTTSSPTKVEALRSAGSGVPLCRSQHDVVAATRAATADVGVDVIIDIIGEGVVQENIDAARVQGRIICLGRLAGTTGTFNLDEFARKRITMRGVTFRTRTAEERHAAVASFRDGLLPLLGDGRLGPLIDRSFGLSEVTAAEDYLRRSDRIGKIILSMER